jgi:hypothetical protein
LQAEEHSASSQVDWHALPSARGLNGKKETGRPPTSCWAACSKKKQRCGRVVGYELAKGTLYREFILSVEDLEKEI